MRFVVLCILILPSIGFAGLSANGGYNNPPGATLGINLLNIWTDWAFEGGIGYARAYTDDNGKSVTALAGGLNVKHLFMTGDFRPYAQAGTGWGFSSSGESASVGTSLGASSGLYLGGGAFVLASTCYAYGSYNFNASGGGGFFQFGLGFNL